MARTAPIIIRRGPFTIQQIPAELLPFETYAFVFRLSIITTWTIWTLYTVFQISLLVRVQIALPGIPTWQLWTALVSEALLDFPSVVLGFSIALGLFSVPDASPRPRYTLQGDIAPDVDIMITCCGEPVNVILNTAAAAATQSYPSGRVRVYLLDDARDGDLRYAIEELDRALTRKATNHASIIYLSRTLEPGQFSHFKSGNLRFGIQESRNRFSSDQYPDSRAPSGSLFLAALDADMIPEKDWLRRMVPHLLLDDNMGLACPPQTYYNVTQTDALGQQADFDIYFTLQEALNDRLGAAMCTGSGYVARRSAIESIGGWPLAISGEDYLCSAMLSDKGWGIAFVSNSVAAE
ncbi:MAG: hypothetical protein LQ338_005761 [Usnochroma carphineum]|nr:MAG: hypothetical protein LQ338_005761 [Usnochroma carphineum]